MLEDTFVRIKRHANSTTLLLTAVLFLGLNVQVSTYLVAYNVDAVTILKKTYGSSENLLPYTQSFLDRSSVYQEFLPCASGSLSTLLAIRTNQLRLASHLFDRYPCVRSRFTFPDMSWKNSNNVLIGGHRGWDKHRQIAVNTMFLNALHKQESVELEEALDWFRKGLVLAPGRIPDYARQNYYVLLTEWYARQGEEILSAKARCLITSDKDCLESVVTNNLMNWRLPENTAFVTNEDWQLTALEIDRDVLEFGIEVRGHLYWQRRRGDQVERVNQDFLVPNLAPNAGFEIDTLFRDNCVSGYVSSHLYVLPCVGYAAPDPYHQYPGHVAIIETQESGFALTSATFPIESSDRYLVGGRLCSEGGADALMGYDLINTASESNSAYNSVGWVFSQSSSEAETECWQQHTAFLELPTKAEELRIRLQREGFNYEHGGRAMFDDVFFFEIPSPSLSK